MGDRPAHRRRACGTHTRTARVARVRRRDRRRHGGGERAPPASRALPDRAVPRRRQGDQPRGREAHPGEAPRSFLRASPDRRGAHQPELSRGARAASGQSGRPVTHQLARGRPRGTYRARVRPADQRTPSDPGRLVEGAHEPKYRQSGLCRTFSDRALPLRSPVHARRGDPQTRYADRRLRPRHRGSAVSRAASGRAQGAARARTAHRFACPGGGA